MKAPGKPWLSEYLSTVFFLMLKNEGQKLVFFCLCPQSSYSVRFSVDKVPFQVLPCFQGSVLRTLRKSRGRAAICKPLLFVASVGLFPFLCKYFWLFWPYLHAVIPPSSQEETVVPCKNAAQWKHSLSASYKQPWTTQPHRSHNPSYTRLRQCSRILPLLYLLLHSQSRVVWSEHFFQTVKMPVLSYRLTTKEVGNTGQFSFPPLPQFLPPWNGR